VTRSTRDHANSPNPYTFVGADGVANTADNDATPFLDAMRSARDLPIGYPRMERVAPQLLSELFRTNPEYFVLNETAQLNQTLNQSIYAEEVIASGYLRADATFMQGRLKMTGGLRAEQTNVEGFGRLTDPTLNFQRDASGNILRGSNGQPLLIHPGNSIDALRITNIDRGKRAEKEYLRWFPSLNATYAITNDFLVRAGYFHSVGRPPINQYAGALSLPNLESGPGPNNVINVNNAAIKAWDARTLKVSVEYYFKEVGLFSVAGFTREVENFFGATDFAPTPEFLALYDLDPGLYGQYSVRSQTNLPGKVRLTGADFNYKQALTFLPDWARGVQVFVNGAAQRVTGESAEEFAGYVPRTASWGLSLTRPKFTLRARWNYTSRNRNGLIATGRSIPEGTYNWRAARTLVNLSGDYQLTRNLTLFVNYVNMTEDPMDLEIANDQTPAVAHLRSHETLGGSLLSIGVKASF
jgi:TonB-dependent receptor